MWNDTDIPLAYLITFRCHGTWLHGDERGSVNRFNNQYKSALLKPDEGWLEDNREKLKSGVIILNGQQRTAVENAIREVCEYRNWLLRAVNVRTNHVHIVVAVGNIKPENALNSFKSYSTRRMRENDCWQSEQSPWSDKGSRRYLWNERALELAIDYVVNGQGDESPDFL